MTTAADVARAHRSREILADFLRDGIDLISALGILGICVRYCMTTIPEAERTLAAGEWAKLFLGCDVELVDDDDDDWGIRH